MAPVVGRMHMSNPSNPFAHLNPQHAIPQTSHYQSQSTHIPNSFNPQHAFGNSALNGGISPFNPSSPYGTAAFGGAATASTFSSGMMGSQQGHGLGSAAAQAGFARGAAMQEHGHQIEAAGMAMKTGAAARIREVWKYNMDSEFHVLRQLIQKYPYVSMDAEFPGIVARPIGNFAGSKAEYHYQTLRCNVDILKPIQVGITLWDPEGNLIPQQDPTVSFQPNGKPSFNSNLINQNLPCTWVFNFSFNLDEDMYAESSIELLKSSGVDFQRHAEYGISCEKFGSLLTTSGLVFSEDVHWLSFHSGYDFGYLIKLLSNDALPMDQVDFFNLVTTYFPKLWDIKFLLRHAQRMRNIGRLPQAAAAILESLAGKSGLADLAEELGCSRVGNVHTAGSDAWLTGQVFWAMKSKIFNGELEEGLSDQIYGLHGVPAPASQQVREEFLAAQGTPAGHTNGASGSGLAGLGATFTPSNNPSTPTTQHAGLSTQTPGPHYGGTTFGNYQYK